MQKKIFFDAVRGPLFGGAISLAQMYGTEGIIDRALIDRTPLRHLAYMLATAFHETARTMQPILETRQPTEKSNPSIATAIKRLDASFAAGKLPWVKRPYWRKDAEGKSWLGRGLVQLTHRPNYEKMSKIVGVDLLRDPGRAMEPGIAVAIMFEGMTRGSFTGRPLSDYLDGRSRDYVNARRVINGKESAAKVAGYAERFEQALTAAGYSSSTSPTDGAKPLAPSMPSGVEGDEGANLAGPVPQTVAMSPEAVDPEKLDKPMVQSKTVWQWLLTIIGAPIAAFGGFDWRVQLAIVVLITGFGIYAIKRRADLAKVYRELKDEIVA